MTKARAPITATKIATLLFVVSGVMTIRLTLDARGCTASCECVYASQSQKDVLSQHLSRYSWPRRSGRGCTFRSLYLLTLSGIEARIQRPLEWCAEGAGISQVSIAIPFEHHSRRSRVLSLARTLPGPEAKTGVVGQGGFYNIRGCFRLRRRVQNKLVSPLLSRGLMPFHVVQILDNCQIMFFHCCFLLTFTGCWNNLCRSFFSDSGFA